jgi:hypothetical protein
MEAIEGRWWEQIESERRLSSAIADHRKEELLNPCSAFDIGSRHKTGHRGGLTVILVMFHGLIVVFFWFLRLTRELLVQLPQLDLEFFERLPLDFILRVALQVATPPVLLLEDDVFCGMHWESIAGVLRGASEGMK